MGLFRNHAASATVVLGIFTGIFIGFWVALLHDLPQLNDLKQFKPAAVTRIWSMDGILLTDLYRTQRMPIPIETVPKHLIDAITATEDRNFFNHAGIDLKGIARAIVRDIQARRYVEGASTITQQLAKTLFFSSEKSILRKLKEVAITFQIERRFTKLEILELYLNQIYLGSGAYGIEAAASVYFGKPAAELSLAECALIAGMPKAPSRYSPLNNPDLALERRNLILQQMADLAMISREELASAETMALNLRPEPTDSGLALFFTSHVRQRLESLLGPEALYTQGLTVKTTLNTSLQAAAEAAARQRAAQMDQRNRSNDPKSTAVECAFVAVENATGRILACSGGLDFQTSPYDRAFTARRQPGSAFKPFIYAAAIAKGLEQNHLVLDAPLAFQGNLPGTSWEPANFSGSFLGEMSLRKALALSKNTPAVRLLEFIGPEAIAGLADRAGIRSPLTPNLTLALGTSEVTLVELAGAYAIFPNQGRWIEPHAISEVTDASGRALYTASPDQRAVLSRQEAALVTDMLKGVIQEGTGRKALSLGRDVGGKTGTTDHYRDAWFVGFSPEITLGVWVGRDDAASLGPNETGSKAALPVWIDIMEVACRDSQTLFFDIPDQTRLLYMDPTTGKTTTEPGPGMVKALFRAD